MTYRCHGSGRVWFAQYAGRLARTPARIGMSVRRLAYLTAADCEQAAVILKSETYHFHRLDLTRQAGFIVTIYDEDGLRLAATTPLATPAEAFNEARKKPCDQIVGLFSIQTA